MARVPTTPQNTSAKSLYGVALSYLSSVKLIIAHEPKPPGARQPETLHDGHIFSKRMLLGFSLELYLKAYLVATGTPVEDIPSYGHDIVRLHTDALASGLSTERHYAEIVRQLAPQHATFEYRYVNLERDWLDMSYEYVTNVLELLDRAVMEVM